MNMKNTPLTELMHAVLDSEATSKEAQQLERQLAADPAARAEFDELKRLFDDLAGVPKAYPPEGLVSSVMASLSQQTRSNAGVHQPFAAPREIGSTFRDAPDSGSGRSARNSGDSQRWPNFRSNEMSEQKSGSKRKIWIGGAIAAAAVVLVMSSGIDFPPGTKDTSGTIVPATRYKAPQNTAEDVKLGAPGSSAQSTTAPAAGDAAANAASSAQGAASANQANSAAAANQANSAAAANQANGAAAANQANSAAAANQAKGAASGNSAAAQAAGQASGAASANNKN